MFFICLGNLNKLLFFVIIKGFFNYYFLFKMKNLFSSSLTFFLEKKITSPFLFLESPHNGNENKTDKRNEILYQTQEALATFEKTKDYYKDPIGNAIEVINNANIEMSPEDQEEIILDLIGMYERYNDSRSLMDQENLEKAYDRWYAHFPQKSDFDDPKNFKKLMNEIGNTEFRNISELIEKIENSI